MPPEIGIHIVGHLFFLFACPGAQPEATEQLCHLQEGERHQPGGKQEAAGQEHEPPTGINANAERKGEAVQRHSGPAAGEQHTANKGASN